MNAGNMQKNKIGARKLTAEEVRLILPTYNQIYMQIDQFRSEKNTERGYEEKKEERDIDQKTNNIGIIGVRGAGKTSILKTIRAQLQEHRKENNDIVLPIVVPENMSESSTLMATILGMLSDEVDEKDKEQSKGKNADCVRKSDLRSCCDEVIRQYTYIQKEYRDILIHEYTTDNQYVSSSAKVFNSDTEFIRKFYQLIEKLMNKSDQGKGLLFVFIDDIDLSTYRCADVVKTLLSYLSNENIVTLISGDLDTFEEALTMDFLRQEKALEKDILVQRIGNQTVLSSKKQLAYEYLKKILPPVYRHNIKRWSLEERAGYYVIGEEKRGAKSLSDLLEEALEGWVAPAFFRYMEKETKMPLPYTYSLFDNTSRGLNNVYNVLSDIAGERKQYREAQAQKEKDGNPEEILEQGKRAEQRKLEQKKMLLDTIVSSKEIYNKYREQIQRSMYTIGFDLASSRVYFDNARSIIYEKRRVDPDPEAANKKGRAKKQEEGKADPYEIEEAADRFSLFLLVEFAARLLYEKEYGKITSENEYYINLKNKAMEDFFFHPDIAEKVLDVGDLGWEEDSKFNPGNARFRELSLGRLNRCFLVKGDLTLNLAYYKNLPLEKALELYRDNTPTQKEGADKKEIADKKENQIKRESAPQKDDVELRQSVIIALWKAITSTANMNGIPVPDQVAQYYPVYTMEFLYIRDQLSVSRTQNEVMRLFDGLWDTAYRAERGTDATGVTWAALQKEQRIKRVMMNTIAQDLKEEGDSDSIKEEWVEFSCDGISGGDGKPVEPEDIQKRVALLKAMDRGKLWGETMAEAAVAYLESEIARYLQAIKKCLYYNGDYAGNLVRPESEITKKTWEPKPGGEWRLNTSAAVKSWEDFCESEDGVSKTKSKQTKKQVWEKLSGHSFKDNMPYAVYEDIMEILRKLAANDKVWYGRAEAQKVLDSLQLGYAVLDLPQGTDYSWYNESYFIFLLQCYYKYKRFVGDAEGISRDASLLAEIATVLSDAYERSDEQIMNTFVDRLNGELAKENADTKISIEEYEEIFAGIKEGSKR